MIDVTPRITFIYWHCYIYDHPGNHHNLRPPEPGLASIFHFERLGLLEFRLSGLLPDYRPGNGSRHLVSFKLRPYYLPIKITPRITKCEAGREVVWEGDRLGIHALHRFDFQEVGDKVMVTSTEQFGGPLFFFSRLLFIPQRLHRLSQKMLADIKKQPKPAWPGATGTAQGIPTQETLARCSLLWKNSTEAIIS